MVDESGAPSSINRDSHGINFLTTEREQHHGDVFSRLITLKFSQALRGLFTNYWLQEKLSYVLCFRGSENRTCVITMRYLVT